MLKCINNCNFNAINFNKINLNKKSSSKCNKNLIKFFLLLIIYFTLFIKLKILNKNLKIYINPIL